MKTLTEILNTVMEADTVFDGLWQPDNAPEDYPQAVRGKLINRLFEDLTPEERQKLQSWCSEIQPCWRADDKSEQNTYYEYPDGSVYFSCTAVDDIWESVGDLAVAIVERPSAFGLDKMDVALLEHCSFPVYKVCRDHAGALRSQSSWATESDAVESAQELKRERPEWEVVVMKNKVEIQRISAP